MKTGCDPAFLPADCLFVTLLHCPIKGSVFFTGFRFYICLLPSVILVEDIDQNGHICKVLCGKIYVMS
jgi:hypothetical protein